MSKLLGSFLHWLLEKMVSKLRLLSLAAFVAVAVLAIGTCDALEVVFGERARRRSLNVAGVRQVMTGVANMINAIDANRLYQGGGSFSRVFKVRDDVEVTIRLYFFNRVNSINGWCSINPAWNQVMRGQAMLEIFEDIYQAMVRSALEGFYGHMQAVAGSLGIEYIVPVPETSDLGYSFVPHNTTMFKPEVSFPLDDNSPCWVYSTCLISGEDGALGSYLAAGASLISGNEMYELIMQKDCNLVLYDISMGGYLPKWDSKTQNRASGCYANLQMDGNLVVVDSTGVDVLWASNTYCRRATGLAVQDDGNLVIYDTDLRKPIWSIF